MKQIKHLLLTLIITLCLNCQRHHNSEVKLEHQCGAKVVTKTLPWECRYQNPDGSWGEQKYRRVFTSLLLMKLLYEGKTPSSDTFGKTIVKAMKYLTLIEAKNILEKRETSFSSYLVFWSIKLSNNFVKAEVLTKVQSSLEELLNSRPGNSNYY